MTTLPPVMLRPLNIGEIFDRAISLYVQNFVVFALMLLTLLVPLAVVQYGFQGDQTAQLQQAIQTIENPTLAAKSHTPINPFPYSGPQLVFFVVVLLAALAISPVANNAVAIGVAALYTGRKPDFAVCYGQALRRWSRLIGALVVIGIMLMTAYIAGLIAIVIVAVIGVALVKVVLPAAILLFVVAGCAFLALILALIVLTLAGYFAMFSVSIEGKSPISAVSSALQRIFNRGELARAVLMSLAYLALEFGVASISGTISLVFILVLKIPALEIAVSSIVSAVLTGFVTTLVAVYYYDVRVRREGYDLEAELERLGT